MNYVLTAAQFTGLAAGYGDPDAVALLRDCQLTKRKLLLGRLLAGPAADLLMRAEDAGPAAVADVLWHPHVDVWAMGALKRPDAGYLGQVAAAAAVRAGLDFRVEVPVTDGRAYLPTLGAVATAGDTVVVTPATVGGAGWEPLRRVELEPGYRVAIEDLDPYRDCYQWQPSPRLTDAEAARAAGLLRPAWALLARRHPRHTAAMRVLLHSIVPLVRPAVDTSVSAAFRRASGSIAVAFPDTAEELSLLILHEFMHMKLDALWDLVDLHHREATGRFLAPWRMDPRPVGPLMQGVYAHTGVTEYWRERRREPDAPVNADLEFAYWRSQNRLAVRSLAESGALTTEGVRFVRELARTLDSWDDAVRPDVGATAAAMVRAQTVRWRLHNWRPADAEVREVVAAWRAGTRPPPPAPAGVLRGDAEGEPAGMPGIVGALRASLTGGTTTDEGARALLGDRAPEACSIYTRRVKSDVEDDDAWVGLALAAEAAAPGSPAATALHRRPDLVRSAYRSVERPADVVGVAGWLGVLPRSRAKYTVTPR
jgi:uncharacterized protein